MDARKWWEFWKKRDKPKRRAVSAAPPSSPGVSSGPDLMDMVLLNMAMSDTSPSQANECHPGHESSWDTGVSTSGSDGGSSSSCGSSSCGSSSCGGGGGD